ncbi:hypothetical protein EON62_01140, partial [archaeon]
MRRYNKTSHAVQALAGVEVAPIVGTRAVRRTGGGMEGDTEDEDEVEEGAVLGGGGGDDAASEGEGEAGGGDGVSEKELAALGVKRRTSGSAKRGAR